MTPIYLAIYIATTNDTNGNPRRGWYVSRLDGEPMIPELPPNGRNSGKDPAYTCWVEEGHSGRGALRLVHESALGRTLLDPRRTPAERTADYAAAMLLVRETGRIEVTPAEYRSARKLPRFGGGA